MRILVLGAFSLALSATVATAGPERSQTETQDVSPQRVLYVCDRAPETRRAFVREHGAQAFVTAEQVLAAEAGDLDWDAPRCITAREAQRLEQLRTSRVGD